MDLRIILDIFAILSAIYSTAVWFANHQIKIALEAKIDGMESKIEIQSIRLESKIDRMMQTIGDRIRRQSDANKVNIGIMKGDLENIKSILNNKSDSFCPIYEIEELLPDEKTDFT